MTEVNKQKAKKTAQIAKRVGLVLAAATAATMFVACSPEQKPETCNCVDKEHDCNCGKDNCTCKPKDPKCECDPGTLHVTGEECNSENECDCTHVAGVRLDNGIAVTNAANVANFDEMVGYIEIALEFFSDNQNAYAANNIKEIKIVTGNNCAASIVNKVLTIENSCDDSTIWDALDQWFAVQIPPITLFKQFDNSKNNVRMAPYSARDSVLLNIKQRGVALNQFNEINNVRTL